MPIFEFQSPSGRIYEELFPAGKAPREMIVDDNGMSVIARRVVSKVNFNDWSLSRQREESEDMAYQKASYQNDTHASLGYNPETGKNHTMKSYADAGHGKPVGLSKDL
jgi:hypothetical protein